MGKTLAEIASALKEVQTRGDEFLAQMERLDNNFFNQTNGAWNRYLEGMEMLSELADKEKADAGQRVSGWDGSAQADLIKGIESAKADAVRMSKEYWLTAKRAEGVRAEVVKLKQKCDAAITKKEKKIKKSKSVDELKLLSNQLDNYAGAISLACQYGPHKPDHKLLQ